MGHLPKENEDTNLKGHVRPHVDDSILYRQGTCLEVAFAFEAHPCFYLGAVSGGPGEDYWGEGWLNLSALPLCGPGSCSTTGLGGPKQEAR